MLVPFSVSAGPSAALALRKGRSSAVTEGSDAFIRSEAPNIGSYWVAPAKFLGDQSTATHLEFKRRVEAATGSASDWDLLLIAADGTTAAYPCAWPTSAVFTRVVVPLDDPAGWELLAPERRDSVTRTELRTILSNLSQLRIQTDNRAYEPMATDLDDVILWRSADPSTDTLPPAEAPSRTITAHFTSGAEGWTAENATGVGHQTAGGEGFLHMTTNNTGSRWIAPAAFRGDLTGAYRLAFDRRCVSGGAESQDILLTGPDGLTLAHTIPFGTSQSWTHFEVALDNTTPWFDVATNKPATWAQLSGALADLRALRIYAGNDAYTQAGCDLDAVEVRIR